MKNKTVFLIHRDVEHEFNDVLGVFSTKEKAEVALEKIYKKNPRFRTSDEFSINEWTVDNDDE